MNNYIKVKIQGKNIHNYIKWLIKNKIHINALKIINHNELNIVTDYKNYHLLSKYSKTYKITIIKKYGQIRLFDILKNNIVIISSLILSIIFLYILSNVIFSIDIMYNNQEIKELISQELAKYDIKKYRKKKTYLYLSKIKNKILEDNKDTLEWLEIEESGTKYIVRLVERKKEINKQEYVYQSVIAKKNAIIKSIRAYSGEKSKQINEYVKKGDTIISGILTKPNNTNIYTKANGLVIGEVWYKVDVEYPLYYQEEKVTGKSKKVLTMYFLNKEFAIFPYNKYKQLKKQSTLLFEDNFTPFKIAKEKLYEVVIKEDIYTIEQAIDKAIDEAQNKLKESNHNITKINDIKVLSKQNNNSKIKVSLFISVDENITSIIEIKPSEENIEN